MEPQFNALVDVNDGSDFVSHSFTPPLAPRRLKCIRRNRLTCFRPLTKTRLESNRMVALISRHP